MCISVEFIRKDTLVQALKELYKCVSLSKFIKKDTFVQAQKELYKSVSLSNSSRKTYLYMCRKSCTNVYLCPNSSRKTHWYRCRKSGTNVYLCRIHQERHICKGTERAVQICIPVEFIKEDTFVEVQKERYKCVSLWNSSRKTHLYRCRKSGTNVYLCRIHQERYICTGTERAVQMCISVQSHQERHICTGAERAVQMCISVELIKKETFVQTKKELYKSTSEFIKEDTFVQTQRELYKCVSLSNSSTKTHLYRHRKSCTNVYLCRIHQERHICTDAERAVQICISVELIKKDTFVQAQKQLYKCVPLSNSSGKTHLYRR